MLNESKPILLIDSREQLPYGFERYSDRFREIRRTKLLAGDYSLYEFETQIAFERKSLPDIVNTVIHNRDRFKNELIKLQQYQHAAIIIEATLSEASRPYSFSQAKPQSVIGSLQSFALLYGVHIIFAGPRPLAEAWVADSLLKFYKYLRPVTP